LYRKEKEYIEVERYMIQPDDYETLDQGFWESLTDNMSKRLTIDYETKIEDHEETVITNFANCYIGGGCMTRGAA